VSQRELTEAADEQAAWLEKIRRSEISIDREGRFIHEGAEVAHEGLKRALFRWLDRLPPPDGRYVLRLDERRFAYLEDVADTPLVARAARVDPAGAVFLALSDGSEEALDPATLTVDDAGVLRAWVRGGRLEARLASSAAAVVADQIDVSEDGGRPRLRLAGRSYAIPPRSAR
jgi:hypothetical protein